MGSGSGDMSSDVAAYVVPFTDEPNLGLVFIKRDDKYVVYLIPVGSTLDSVLPKLGTCTIESIETLGD